MQRQQRHPYDVYISASSQLVSQLSEIVLAVDNDLLIKECSYHTNFISPHLISADLISSELSASC